MSMQVGPPDDELARGSAIKLALRTRAALGRRERWLEQAVADFDVGVSERILSDERSAEAFEAAETAEALDQAMASNRGDATEWTAKAMTLLRAVQAADAAYRRELGEAFDRYRNVVTTGSEDDDREWEGGPG
jgi:hypothetical protein